MSDNTPDANTSEPEVDSIGRRAFIRLAAGALGAAYAGMVGYPVYRYLASPVEKAQSEAAVNEVTLDALALPKNTAMMFRFGTKPAMLIHHADGSWSALSAVCTHLGCTAGYKPETGKIFCPCHGGEYDAATGANLAGPPPKPLTTYVVALGAKDVVVRRA